jgi:hypothetical protein
MLNSGQKHSHQGAYDGDDNKQFNERKSTASIHGRLQKGGK